MITKSQLKPVNKCPVFRQGWTRQYEVKIDGVKYEVHQSLRSYGISMGQRGYVKIDGQLYQLPQDWTMEVY